MTDIPRPISPETNHPDNISFTPITADAIPSFVRDALLEIAGFNRETETDSQLASFNNLSSLQHPNGDTSYVATYVKESDESITEEDTLVVDINTKGDVTGAGEVRFFREFRGMPDMVGFPFVASTMTNKDFQRGGLGERRLHTMNTASLNTYGLTLRSGTNLEPEARSIWDRLAAEGRATRLSNDTNFQYKFI